MGPLFVGCIAEAGAQEDGKSALISSNFFDRFNPFIWGMVMSVMTP